MKKMACILLTLLFCFSMVSAFAAKAGDTVTVSFSVKANPNAAAFAGVRFSFDTSVLEFVSADGNGAQPPQGPNGSFVVNNISGIPTGNIGSITFKVKEGAPAGTYTISASVSYAYDSDENAVTGLSVSGGSVKIESDECEHTWGDWKETTAATCDKDGVETRTCTACGETEEETVKAKGHTPGNDAERVEPTCTEDGYTTGGSCTVCGEVLDKEVLPAAGHKDDGGKETKAPTCTEKGEKTYTCTVCDEVVKTEEVAALGLKDDGGKETKAPTCTEKGEKTYTCTVCSDVVKTEEVAALGHKDDGGKETKSPTCTEAGEKVYTCTVCSEVVKTEEVAALGHKPGEWVIIKEATKEEDGLKERYCTVCDVLVDSQVIPHAVWYHMTVCSVGPRFRDESNITDKWDMFTPVDLSGDGEQVFDLIAGNKHIIGSVHVVVADGAVTVTYETINGVTVKGEFLTFFSDLASVTTLDESQLTGYAFGEAISIEEQLNGDTKVLLYIHNDVAYRDDARGLEELAHKTNAFQSYLEELKAVMD